MHELIAWRGDAPYPFFFGEVPLGSMARNRGYRCWSVVGRTATVRVYFEHDELLTRAEAIQIAAAFITKKGAVEVLPV